MARPHGTRYRSNTRGGAGRTPVTREPTGVRDHAEIGLTEPATHFPVPPFGLGGVWSSFLASHEAAPDGCDIFTQTEVPLETDLGELEEASEDLEAAFALFPTR